MKRRSVVAAAAACVAPGWARADPPALGQRVQWPEVALLGGGSFSAAQVQGQAVVVTFWSTTCPFCRRHNEHLQKLHRAAQGKPLQVLTVARDRDPALVQRTVRERGYGFPVTMAYGPMAAALSTRNVIPLTAVVDRQGRLKQVYPGEMFEEDVLEFLELAG